MFRPRTGCGIQVQPGIKADKAALVAYSQAQQIALGNLSMFQQVGPVHVVGIQHAECNGGQSPINCLKHLIDGAQLSFCGQPRCISSGRSWGLPWVENRHAG